MKTFHSTNFEQIWDFRSAEEDVYMAVSPNLLINNILFDTPSSERHMCDRRSLNQDVVFMLYDIGIWISFLLMRTFSVSY